MSWKNKAPIQHLENYFEVEAFHIFSFTEMICIKLWNSVDSWSLGSPRDAKIFSDANLGPRVLLGLQLTSNPHASKRVDFGDLPGSLSVGFPKGNGHPFAEANEPWEDWWVFIGLTSNYPELIGR